MANADSGTAAAAEPQPNVRSRLNKNLAGMAAAGEAFSLGSEGGSAQAKAAEQARTQSVTSAESKQASTTAAPTPTAGANSTKAKKGSGADSGIPMILTGVPQIDERLPAILAYLATWLTARGLMTLMFFAWAIRSYGLAHCISWALFMFVFMTYHLITNQETLLYVPSVPCGEGGKASRKIAENPAGYSSPAAIGLPSVAGSVGEISSSSAESKAMFRGQMQMISGATTPGSAAAPIPPVGQAMLKMFDEQERAAKDTKGRDAIPAGSWKGSWENVFITTADSVKLHAWYFRSATATAKNKKTLLFCHANAGNVGLRLPNFKLLLEQCGPDLDILAFDYRGYGDSASDDTDRTKPSEDGLILDVLACLQWLRQEPRGCEEVFLFGRSLGGAVAIAACSALEELGCVGYQLGHEEGSGKKAEGSDKFPIVRGLILENTFTSIEGMIAKLFPWLDVPLQALPFLKQKFLRLKWYSINRVGDLGAAATSESSDSGKKRSFRVLFFVGAKDEIVPSAHGFELATGMKHLEWADAGGPVELTQKTGASAGDTRLGLTPVGPGEKRVVIVPDGMHNDSYMRAGTGYWEEFRSFLRA